MAASGAANCCCRSVISCCRRWISCGELAVAAFIGNENQRIERAHCLVEVVVLAIERHQGMHERRAIDDGMRAPPRPCFRRARNCCQPHHKFAETFAAARPHLGMQRLVFGIVSAELFEVLPASLCAAAARFLRAWRQPDCTVGAG